MFTVSIMEIAWYSLAWLVVGIVAGYVVPRNVLRDLLGGRPAQGGNGGGAPARRGSGGGVEIYVGNLAYSVSKRDLEKKFGEYGAVIEARIIRNKLTGKSKGYAFVTMADKRGAGEAVKAINGSQFKGRAVVANEAKSRARD